MLAEAKASKLRHPQASRAYIAVRQQKSRLVLKSSASMPMAEPSSKLMEFEQVFRWFDKDGDGKISASELRLCMGTIGEELSAEGAENLVESADSNGDGLLELEDFMRLVEVEGEEERSKDLRAAFEMYEMEGEGCITAKSLKRMLSRLGASRGLDECRAMICRFDLNGDGVLSFDEFRIMMMV
ncbi:putative calcium-binding protein CML19 [Phoenix dactylifera]|uniref:Calcium-binding protein CML19 n=1 Tax=Phoenix dactylifera TaxID=42345 RepID=A0A8B9AAF2_PHODC|nr:putative calcium-binding protein CML19 [Phoenix dactylifera]